jgi:hypothetical protein
VIASSSIESHTSLICNGLRSFLEWSSLFSSRIVSYPFALTGGCFRIPAADCTAGGCPTVPVAAKGLLDSIFTIPPIASKC